MTDSSTIGPYRLGEPLGQGAMGVVYRARHVGSERAIALKTVRVSSPTLLDGIRREIHALTRIKHPGIVRIVDHGVHEGRPWYAMDLLEGESLRHFVQRVWSPYRRPSMPPVAPTEGVTDTDVLSGEAPAPSAPPRVEHAESLPHANGQKPAAAGELTTVLQIVRRVCATLAFLHGEGLVNCDLKPENILLVDGKPIIIDFGLSAHHPGVAGREALEALRAMAGTLPYMSPEQIRGEFLDARSDLYAVGCMLYELVVGAPPYVGAPPSVRSGHLSATPVPPSEVVGGVPPALERLILKLLEKDLADRFGFADEVAGQLAEISSDVHRLPGFPAARPYLYRPRFVGRDEVVKRLAALRDRAADGCGAMVLLAGESGVGKTRVAMEVTRFEPAWRMHIIASEASALATESAAGVGPAPLHILRPVLQAVADRCQEAGEEATERLLGERRSVLALYEPLLAQVPAARGSLPPPMPLAVEASRRRLFAYLAETIAAFAQEQPVLWVIDDLGWADELSLAFLQSLTREYLENTPVFILATYRSEEATDAVTAFAGLAHVRHLGLPRLPQSAVSSMIGDMLALRAPTEGFVEFVAEQAEGNPFFVAEYLRTAVTERVLYRDENHTWQLGEEGRAEALEEYRSLPLPGSLRELIEQRLRRLSPAALKAGLAAAVLGREADFELVTEVAALSEEVAVGAADELVRRQVLEQAGDGRVRFAHDKLREVAYARAPPEHVVGLHARAAVALEARWKDRPDASRQWATLGHHFAAAKMTDPAAAYLKLAADHARTTYANADAIRLYNEAIRCQRLSAQIGGDLNIHQKTLTNLLEASADVLTSVARRDEARTAYLEALRYASDVPSTTSTDAARLQRKIGKTWETEHRHVDALLSYESAIAYLDVDPSHAPSDTRAEWIQVRIDKLWVYYFLDRIADMDALMHELEPIVRSHATPLQRARFLRTHWMRNLRRDRYTATAETLQIARRALSSAAESGDPDQLCLDQFGLGFVLLFHQSLDEACSELQIALELAARAGDLHRQARCLTYLTVGYRMLGRAESVRDYVQRCATIALQSGAREYIATAQANHAWLALRERNLEAAARHAREALAGWRSLSLVYPLQWLALLPMLEVALTTDDLDEAIGCVHGLLDPTQQRLPASAFDAFTKAVGVWHSGDAEDARKSLHDGLHKLEGTVCA